MSSSQHSSPPITDGSPKQIAWAEKIRAEADADLATVAEQYREYWAMDPGSAERSIYWRTHPLLDYFIGAHGINHEGVMITPDEMDAATALWRQQVGTSARWWIDHRGHGAFPSMLEAILRHFGTAYPAERRRGTMALREAVATGHEPGEIDQTVVTLVVAKAVLRDESLPTVIGRLIKRIQAGEGVIYKQSVSLATLAEIVDRLQAASR